MTTPTSPLGAGRPPTDPLDRKIPVLAMVAALAAVIIAVVALVLALRSDDNDIETIDTTTSLSISTTVTTAPAATTAEPTSESTTTAITTTTEPTTTETSIDPAEYQTAVWPWFEAASGPGADRYDDPVDAARGFAIDFVGWSDPVVGDFMAGDSRSGEVEIRNQADGPATTVFVRQLGADDTWWVLGAVTENIVIDRPEALVELDDELVVEGRARTFEGNVEVILRADGRSDPILIETVTGRGDGIFGDFSETFPIDPGSVRAGAAVFLSRSAKDGSVWEAAVTRVYFAT